MRGCRDMYPPAMSSLMMGEGRGRRARLREKLYSSSAPSPRPSETWVYSSPVTARMRREYAVELRVNNT